MSGKFTAIVASRYFAAKKHEKFVSIISGISLAGITIGVAALIIVMSVMNGFHIELTGNIIGLNGDITIQPMARSIEDYEQVLEKLSNSSYIKRITPVVTGQALALGPNANSGALIKGIDVAHLKHKGEILGNVMGGSFADYDGNNVVAVGSELARNLGIFAGSKIKMISPTLISTAFGSMPRSKDFTVVAIFNSGLYEYDAGTMLMPVQAAQKFLAIGDGINLIELNIDDPESANLRAKELQKELGFGVKVTSWKSNNQQFLTALEIERVAMFTILSLIMVVAAFNIVSSLFMMVKDKTKDIAILRTIGASRAQVMTIFILNGMMTGVIGTALGAALGLTISFNIENIRKFLEQLSGTRIFDPAIYFLYSLPSVVRITDVVIISSLSITLCFLATLYPSYKASKLNPVEAMRYE
jgi:lipoprotein-releasing system permease protein